MKGLNFSIEKYSSKDLIEIKAKLNETIDEQIRLKQLSERILEMSAPNMGVIKQLFESCISGITSKDCVRILRKFVKTIKENKSASNTYLLYENMRRIPSNTDTNVITTLFEGASKGINVKELKKSEEKLMGIILEAAINSKMSIDKFNETVEKNKALNESIDFLITNKRTPKNIVECSKSFKEIRSHVASNNKRMDESLNGKSKEELIADLNNLLNEGYEEWEKDTLIDIAVCNLSGKTKEALFEEYKTKCMELLESKIGNTESIEDKSRFETLKESLNQKTYNSETCDDDIFNLSELNATLIAD